jgi:hypothetical protein
VDRGISEIPRTIERSMEIGIVGILDETISKVSENRL